jgi:ABC-type hemin transport system ATPase subunit
MTLRQALAAVLAVVLGAVLVAYPDALVRVHTLGRLPHDRGGSYGEDATVATHWQWLIRAVGVVCVGLGVFFGYQVLT